MAPARFTASSSAAVVLACDQARRKPGAMEEKSMKLYDGGIFLLIIFVTAAVALFSASQIIK